MNKVIFEITKCSQCPNHYVAPIYTADSFEHERGLYCSKVEDKHSCNKKHKLVCSDDWDVNKYSDIPDWCPLLNSNITENANVV